jgi:hypothetical protein
LPDIPDNKFSGVTESVPVTLRREVDRLRIASRPSELNGTGRPSSRSGVERVTSGNMEQVECGFATTALFAPRVNGAEIDGVPRS